jgi:uncharacterized Zn-finger protein
MKARVTLALVAEHGETGRCATANVAAGHGYVWLEILDINFATQPDTTFEGTLDALQSGLQS